MTGISAIDDAMARVQAADQAARTASVAAAVGKFEDYWQAQGQAAKARLDAEYGRSISTSGNSEGGVGGPGAAVSGSSSGGP